MKKSFAEILDGLDKARDRKIALKLPDWDGIEGMEVPSELALEQCSSSATARYKADLLKSLLPSEPTITDLTGGLGIDSSSFARMAAAVNYFERNPELAEAAARNFSRLGLANITVHNETVDSCTDIPTSDLIFADPARRDGAGKKVFLLEDCSPDILPLLPRLFEKAPLVMLKLSPMADISMLASRLGRQLSEVHVVSLGGEVKELLCILPKDHDGDYRIRVVELKGGGFDFLPQDESDAAPVFASGLTAGRHLLEPTAALLKSGAFNLLCSRFRAEKLAPSTHLYISDSASGSPLLKSFLIDEVLPFGGAAFKEVRKRFPRAEVTARNVRMTSDELRKKLGVSPGGDAHIFGCSSISGNFLLICHRI